MVFSHLFPSFLVPTAQVNSQANQALVLMLWNKTSGTWMNVGTVLLGTTIGLLLRNQLRATLLNTITQAVGLITLFIGFNMAGSLLKVQAGGSDGVILGLMTLVMGGMLGEWIQIQTRLESLGDWLKHHVQGGGRFTEGFVTSSLLFCVGPMTVLGCLNNGLTGDPRLLTLKATMDGLAAIALTGSLGIGVGFSSVVMLIYQGGLSLAAGLLAQVLTDPATNPQVLLLSGVGGLIIIGIGLNLLDIAQIRIASFLPALGLAPIGYAIALWLV
jgi:uncharacterized protein